VSLKTGIILVIIGAAIIAVAAWSMSRQNSELWTLQFNQIHEDQSNVIRVREENEKMYEDEIGRLNDELSVNKKQQATVYAENERLKGLIREKNDEILGLRKEREAVIIPSDPSALVIELRRLGYGTEHIRP